MRQTRQCPFWSRMDLQGLAGSQASSTSRRNQPHWHPFGWIFTSSWVVQSQRDEGGICNWSTEILWTFPGWSGGNRVTTLSLQGGQAQCTSLRDFAPFPPSSHRVFHDKSIDKSDCGGLGDGCEVHSAKTLHNTTCINQGNIKRVKGCSITRLAPALTLTTTCF